MITQVLHCPYCHGTDRFCRKFSLEAIAQFIAICRSAKVCEIGENLLSISAPISRSQERLIYASAFVRPPTLQPRTMSRVHPYTPVARSCTPMSPVPESGG